MFFPIRCAFWLTVVYVTIFNTDPAPVAPPERPAAMADAGGQVKAASPSGETMTLRLQSFATTAIEHIWSKATTGCGKAPADCMALAERLGDFARQHPFRTQTTAEPPAAGAEPSQLASKAAPAAKAVLTDVPLPPRRPRNAPAERPSAALRLRPGIEEGAGHS